MLALCPEYKLSNKVSSLFIDRGRRLIHLIKPIIVKYATDADSLFRTSWGGMSALQQTELGRLVHELEPRLLQHFEGGWATDWIFEEVDRPAGGRCEARHKTQGRAKGRREATKGQAQGEAPEGD